MVQRANIGLGGEGQQAVSLRCGGGRGYIDRLRRHSLVLVMWGLKSILRGGVKVPGVLLLSCGGLSDGEVVELVAVATGQSRTGSSSRSASSLSTPPCFRYPQPSLLSPRTITVICRSCIQYSRYEVYRSLESLSESAPCSFITFEELNRNLQRPDRRNAVACMHHSDISHNPYPTSSPASPPARPRT